MENFELNLRQWISQQLGTHEFQFNALPGDASFRAYFRIRQGANSYIAMLAPPSKERTDDFVRIACAWHEQGVLVPEILAWEKAQGFVLLTDFGDALLLDNLNPQNVENYYRTAMHALVDLQKTCPKAIHLPPYDAQYAMLELSYFQDWFVHQLLGISFSAEESTAWADAAEFIIQQFCAIPQATVHRDYHSRNLMVVGQSKLGIIDFQDAMVGPITYDLVSLLKDCYITWPHNDINRWVSYFYEKLQEQQQLAQNISLAQFNQWFDIVGLQRHLKVLGIFSRLKLRDNKAHYLQHLPRIMQYILNVTTKYAVLGGFHQFMVNTVLPKMEAALLQQGIHSATEVKVA